MRIHDGDSDRLTLVELAWCVAAVVGIYGLMWVCILVGLAIKGG